MDFAYEEGTSSRENWEEILPLVSLDLLFSPFLLDGEGI
jgi:hypothetical protein